MDFAARIAWQDLPMAGRRTLAALSPRRLGCVVAAQFALGESSRQGALKDQGTPFGSARDISMWTGKYARIISGWWLVQC